MEVLELLTNHYAQIIYQTYARCFTHTPLLTHLKTHMRYIFIVSILHVMEKRVTNICLPCTFPLFFLLPPFTSTQKRRSIVGSIPGYFK